MLALQQGVARRANALQAVAQILRNTAIAFQLFEARGSSHFAPQLGRESVRSDLPAGRTGPVNSQFPDTQHVRLPRDRRTVRFSLSHLTANRPYVPSGGRPGFRLRDPPFRTRSPRVWLVTRLPVARPLAIYLCTRRSSSRSSRPRAGSPQAGSDWDSPSRAAPWSRLMVL